MKIIPQRVTLVHQVEGILRDGIKAGRWTQTFPAEFELCQELQVSRTTLRAALATLTRERLIRSWRGKRRRITKSSGAESPAPKSGRVLLLLGVSPHAVSLTSGVLLNDLRERLAKAGFELEVHTGHAFQSRRPDAALERLLNDRRPAAWVLSSTTEAVQRWFMARGLPCVLIGSCHAGVTLPTVEADFKAAGQHAARQLLSRGHRRIALVLPALGMAGEPKMVEGVLSVTAEESDVHVRIVEHDGTPASVRRRVESALKPTPPTGLVVAGAAYSIGVMTVLSRAGLRVPEDVSVIARDREPYLDFVMPPLTGYSTAPARFSQRLSRTVMALVQGGSAPVRSQLLLPQFIPGETLGYVSRENTTP